MKLLWSSWNLATHLHCIFQDQKLRPLGQLFLTWYVEQFAVCIFYRITLNLSLKTSWNNALSAILTLHWLQCFFVIVHDGMVYWKTLKLVYIFLSSLCSKISNFMFLTVSCAVSLSIWSSYIYFYIWTKFGHISFYYDSHREFTLNVYIILCTGKSAYWLYRLWLRLFKSLILSLFAVDLL